MNSALLRQEKIDLYSPVLVGDGYGHYNTEWKYEKSVRAGVLNKSMNRVVDNGEVVYDKTTHLVVRSYVQIQEDWQIEWNGYKWQIISIVDNKYYLDKEIIVAKIEE